MPIVAYAALIASALLAIWQPGTSAFCVAATTLLLLLIGIHNAWDGVTYHVFVKQSVQHNH